MEAPSSGPTYRIGTVTCKAAVSDPAVPEKLTEQGSLLKSPRAHPPTTVVVRPGGSDGAQGENRVGAEGCELEQAGRRNPPGGSGAAGHPGALVVPAARPRRQLGGAGGVRIRRRAAGSHRGRRLRDRDLLPRGCLCAGRRAPAAVVCARRILVDVL